METIHSSISFNLDQHIVAAALPLFEAERVAAIEWSFDTLYKTKEIPAWFVELLTTFGNEQRLIGHGVYYSLLSGGWSREQSEWLKQLGKTSQAFKFDHITEHFGFMTGRDFHQGAPLPIPLNSATLSIGIDRLRRIQDACHCPVGIENMAFSYSLSEVQKHGDFLAKLVDPINGFIILDLHNVYCQGWNFNVQPATLLSSYPLERVREIHISGGSWEQSDQQPGKLVRRDTHDDGVPEEVFDLLQIAIPLCPNLKFVVLEQLGSGLDTEEKRTRYRLDFFQMNTIVENAINIQPVRYANYFLPFYADLPHTPVENELLKEQQDVLSLILENATSYEEARQQLIGSSLAATDWHVENWEPAMLETAIAIAKKWKHGFA